MCLGYLFNYIDNVYNNMFYTLVSKSFIKQINLTNDYLYIFLAGSIAYVCIHWYLNIDNQTGIKERIKNYFYYIMMLDGIIAYTMLKIYAKKMTKETEDQQEDNNNVVEYTPEQKMLILQKSREARQLQQQQQQQHKEKLQEENEEVIDAKPSIFTKSEESSSKDSTSKKKDTVKVVKKVSEPVDDTEIPVYKKQE